MWKIHELHSYTNGTRTLIVYCRSCLSITIDYLCKVGAWQYEYVIVKLTLDNPVHGSFKDISALDCARSTLLYCTV